MARQSSAPSPGRAAVRTRLAGASLAHAAPTPHARWGAWLAWLLRAGLLAMLAYALVRQDRPAIVTGIVGLAVSLAPLAVERLGAVRVPRPLDVVVVLGAVIQVASVTFNLYDHVWQWGKGVHGAETFLATLAAGWLLEGYRQHRPERALGISTLLAATATLLTGMTLSVFWEMVEFYLDWVRQLDLQKSNTDTMTDLLWSHLAALLATMLAFRLYYHAFSDGQRVGFGHTADWLTEGPAHVLERHGRLVGMVVCVAIALLVLGLWSVDRRLPGLPTL